MYNSYGQIGINIIDQQQSSSQHYSIYHADWCSGYYCYCRLELYNYNPMKINIKNLKGEIFSIEIEPTQTIANLKQKIEVQKAIPAESQKIIFKGKTANNDDLIQKLGLKQSDFLVVMSQVTKPAPKQKVEQKVEQPQKTQEKKEIKKEDEKKDNKAPPASNQAQINQLMAMGFLREQCVAALRAAFNDSSRAVEYLLNGLPSEVPQNQSAGSNPLSALMTLPQFQEMRALIQSDPNSLPQVLSQLAQTSPQLYNIIVQHPDQFEQLLGEQGDELYLQQQGDQEQQMDEQQGNEQQLVISQEEQAAIARLSNLGFSKLQAAQAYIACDKNEEMAANLLFDRLANGDIEQQMPGQGGEEDDDNLFN